MKILYYATGPIYQKPNPSFHLLYARINDLLANNDEIYFLGIKDPTLDKHIPDEFLANHHFHFDLVEQKSHRKNNFFMRYLDGMKYALRSYKYLKKNVDKVDLIFIGSSPTIVYNIFLARRLGKGKKIVLNVQDMFPGSSVASGILRNPLLISLFQWIQKFAYGRADAIIAISEDMKNKLIEQGVVAHKIEVIVNWFDDSTVHEVEWENNRFVKKYHLSNDKFYLQYAGTMGFVFDYKMVLNVAEKLLPYDDIEIQMIGQGSQKDVFVREAAERNLSNIKFYPLEPQEMVSDVYSTCSACFIPLKHGVIGNSVPSKAGLLMACNRPIVTSVDAECVYATEINQNRIGFACPDNDVDSNVKSILYLYQHRQETVEMGKRGYRYGYNLYSRTNNMKKYIDLFYKLVDNETI